MKSDLLSMVNHELRTPLTSIITLAQIALESGGADAEERRSWEEVRKSSSVLLGMINDMLDTPREYMEHLKAANIPVVNFEDEGPGSVLADQVVNALYEEPQNETNGKQPERFLYGHKYFCLRDEFLQAEQNAFRPDRSASSSPSAVRICPTIPSDAGYRRAALP